MTAINGRLKFRLCPSASLVLHERLEQEQSQRILQMFARRSDCLYCAVRRKRRYNESDNRQNLNFVIRESEYPGLVIANGSLRHQSGENGWAFSGVNSNSNFTFMSIRRTYVRCRIRVRCAQDVRSEWTSVHWRKLSSAALRCTAASGITVGSCRRFLCCVWTFMFDPVF